jgi:hypothetical protein
MRFNLSAWQTGALLSVIALASHGSGAVNLDGLNPLLAAGCAHHPGSRLMVRNARDEKRSVTLKANHRIQLTLKDGSTVEGLFVEKTDEPAPAARPEVAPDGVLFVPASPSTGRSVTLQLEDGSVQQVPIAQIRGIGFNHPRDGWKYARIGAFIGAIPAALVGSLLSEIAGGGGTPSIDERLGWMAICAPFGAVPGAALVGLGSFIPGTQADLETGDEWLLE